MEAFETLDKRFASYTIPIVFLEKLHTGLRWAEGPVYFADQRCLLFSDLPNNRILRFDEQTSQVTVFRPDSNFSNGNTRDRQGRLVTCEHRGRRVTRTEYDGTITVLAERYQGKRLNSPNDVVVKIGRHGVVHRSHLWHQRGLRGRQGGKRDRKLQRLWLRSA